MPHCRASLVLAVAVAAAALALRLLVSMPAPFEFTPPRPLTPRQVAGLQAAETNHARGGMRAFLEARARRPPRTITAGNTTRLFRGKVVGAESLQYNHWNRSLVMLDRTGTLHTAALQWPPQQKENQAEGSANPTSAEWRRAVAATTLKGATTYLGPGRPLGYDVYGPDELLICDTVKGLVHVSGVRLDGDGGAGSGEGATGIGDAGAGGPRLEVLANHYQGRPLTYVNDLAVAYAADDPNGSGGGDTVYFSSSADDPVVLRSTTPRCVPSASAAGAGSGDGGDGSGAAGTGVGAAPLCYDGFFDTLRSYILNTFAGDATGRVFRYNMATRRTELLVDGLWFANGVAHGRSAEGHEFLLVVETTGFRVYKKWLTGPKARFLDAARTRVRPSSVADDVAVASDPSIEVVLEGLPGFCDGISEAADGENFWLAVASPYNPPVVHVLLSGWPWLRTLAAWLFVNLNLSEGPFVKFWGMAVKISPDGEVLEAHADWTGNIVQSTASVVELPDGAGLLLGTLSGDYVSVVHFDNEKDGDGGSSGGGA